MDDPTLVIAVVLVAVAVVALLVYSLATAGRRRSQRWKDAAPGLGLVYQGDDPSLPVQLSDFRLFDRGHRRRFANVMRGSVAGAEACLTDYQYTTGSGKNSSTHRWTVVVLRSPGIDLPHLFVRREIPLVDALGQLLGGQDIDFPEDPEFSRAFVLQGRDAEAIRRFFTLDVRHGFLRLLPARLQVEARGDLVAYHEGRRISPDSARELMQRAGAALETLRASA